MYFDADVNGVNVEEIVEHLKKHDCAKVAVGTAVDKNDVERAFIYIVDVPADRAEGYLETIPDLIEDVLQEENFEDEFIFSAINSILPQVIRVIRKAGWKDVEFCVENEKMYIHFARGKALENNQ